MCIRDRSCPVHVLEGLARDKDADVRWMVAMNPTCPTHVLETLAKDQFAKVRHPVASNPNWPVEIIGIETLQRYEALNEEPVPLTIEDCVYPGCQPKLKLLAALQPDCPKEQLFKSANSSDPLERLAAALNPMLPIALVMRLIDDPDVNVQRAAARHPNCKPASEVH